MELQSSKRIVKCLCRIILAEQLCFPQSYIERFDFLCQRLLKRSLTQEAGLTPVLWATKAMLLITLRPNTSVHLVFLPII